MQNIVAQVQSEKAQVSETAVVDTSGVPHLDPFPVAEQEGPKIYDTPVTEQKMPEPLAFPRVEQEPTILSFPHEEPIKPQLDPFPVERPRELGDIIIMMGKEKKPVQLKWGNPKSVPTYGHTFTEHGAKRKPNQLIDRANAKGVQIGQWIDEKSAADFLAKVAQEKGPGVHEVPLPESLDTRVFTSGGTEIIANMARVIVKEDGSIRTAFPYNSNFSSGIGD